MEFAIIWINSMINADVYLERKKIKPDPLVFWESISLQSWVRKLQDQEMYVVLKNQYVNSINSVSGSLQTKGVILDDFGRETQTAT